MKSLIAFALISGLFIFGCTSYLAYSDPIVGCWHFPGAFGLTADYSFGSDGTFIFSSSLEGASGKWERLDDKTVSVTYYNQIMRKVVTEKIIYDDTTATIYAEYTSGLRLSKIKCPSN